MIILFVFSSWFILYHSNMLLMGKRRGKRKLYHVSYDWLLSFAKTLGIGLIGCVCVFINLLMRKSSVVHLKFSFASIKFCMWYNYQKTWKLILFFLHLLSEVHVSPATCVVEGSLKPKPGTYLFCFCNAFIEYAWFRSNIYKTPGNRTFFNLNKHRSHISSDVIT